MSNTWPSPRVYYACFQAAIAALLREGIWPLSSQWGHGFVQAQFAGQLVSRRHLYPVEVWDSLQRTYRLRQTADYEARQVADVGFVCPEACTAVYRGGACTDVRGV